MLINLEKISPLWFSFSTERRLQFWGLLLIMIFASILEAVSVGGIIPFLTLLTSSDPFQISYISHIAELLKIKDSNTLFLLATVIFCFLIIFSGILRFLLVFVESRYSQAIGADLSSAIYLRTLYQPYHVHISRNSSEIISGISNKVNGVVHHVLMPLLIIVSSLLMISAIMCGLLLINRTIALSILFSFGFIYLFVAFFTRTKLIKNGVEVNEKSGELIKVVQEGLGGIRDILVDGTQAIFCGQFDAADKQLRRSSANIQIISASPRFIVESVGITVIALVAYSSTAQNISFLSMLPTLGAFLFGAQRLLPICQQVYSSWSTIKGADASLGDVLHLLEQPLPNELNRKNQTPCGFQKKISLKNIYFRYPLVDSWAIKNVSLEINKGARIGICGQTGSGKTTIMDILMGLLQPTEGNLLVDDVDITLDNCSALWFPHIAHVPQSIYLSDASIAENIAFGIRAADIDYERISSVCKLVQLDKFIECLPAKDRTMVGERGAKLSGGQKQKIGIARALYKNADVLIFDEATSALDGETEASIISAINGLNRQFTIIMIAHRLSTLSVCDLVFEIEAGEIKRNGSYGEIILGNYSQGVN